MHFTINGKPLEASADIRTSNLDPLRDHLSLVGAGNVWNQGACARDWDIVTVELLRETSRDASQPGLGSLSPRLETASL